MFKMVMRGEHLSESVQRRYNRIKKANQKFGIESGFGRQTFFVTDLEIIKHVLIKDFDHFQNSIQFATLTNNEDLVGRMVISAQSYQWRALRSKLGLAFSPAKLKRMFHYMDSSGKKLVKYLNLKADNASSGSVNMTAAFSKFSIDVITSSAFGLDANIFEESRASNFLGKMMSTLEMGGIRMILQTAMVSICPALSDFLNYSIIDGKAQEFFKKMIINTVRIREQNREQKRDDFIEFLLETRDEQNQPDEHTSRALAISLEPIDIAAHCLSVFLAGNDTLRIALELLAYNLAVQPEIQERIFQELQNAVAENDGGITYKILDELDYLDNVIAESMRIVPVSPITMRICTKDFFIPGTSVIIPEGSSVVIPVSAIQSDSKYFPNPQQFIPERFFAENKSKIPSCSYLPFGQGPRMCMGVRLSLLELKVAISHVVLNFSLERSQKTRVPLKFSSTSMLSAPAGGLWLKVRRR